jgi:hypothetical protein
MPARSRSLLSAASISLEIKSDTEWQFTDIRAAQTGVFDLDIRISNRPFIDVCKSFAAETGLESRNVEKRINACLSGPIAILCG